MQEFAAPAGVAFDSFALAQAVALFRAAAGLAAEELDEGTFQVMPSPPSPPPPSPSSPPAEPPPPSPSSPPAEPAAIESDTRRRLQLAELPSIDIGSLMNLPSIDSLARGLLDGVLAINRRIPSYHANRHPALVPSFFASDTTVEAATIAEAALPFEQPSGPGRRLSWHCIAAVFADLGSGESDTSVTFIQVTSVVTTTDQGRFAALLAMLTESSGQGTGTLQNAITNAAGESLTRCDDAWLEGTQRRVIPAPAPPPPRPNAALGGLRIADFVNLTNPGMAALSMLLRESAGTIQAAAGAAAGAATAASAASGGGPSGAGNSMRGAQRLSLYSKLGPPNADGDDNGGGGFTTGRFGLGGRRSSVSPDVEEAGSGDEGSGNATSGLTGTRRRLDVNENENSAVSKMLGDALIDTVTSLGVIFGGISSIHYLILFWYFAFANRKYYAYHRKAKRAARRAERRAARWAASRTAWETWGKSDEGSQVDSMRSSQAPSRRVSAPNGTPNCRPSWASPSRPSWRSALTSSTNLTAAGVVNLEATAAAEKADEAAAQEYRDRLGRRMAVRTARRSARRAAAQGSLQEGRGDYTGATSAAAVPPPPPPPRAPRPAEADPWLATKDKASGDTYYYRRHSKEVQWERPADFGAKQPPASTSRALVANGLTTLTTVFGTRVASPVVGISVFPPRSSSSQRPISPSPSSPSFSDEAMATCRGRSGAWAPRTPRVHPEPVSTRALPASRTATRARVPGAHIPRAQEELAVGEVVVEGDVLALKLATSPTPRMLPGNLREVFDKFDTNRSGYVSMKELKSMINMLKLGLSDAAVQKMMTDSDINGSGEISFEEFVKMLKERILSRVSATGVAMASPRESTTQPTASPQPNQPRKLPLFALSSDGLPKPPTFRRLPAMLRVPNVQNILGVTFAGSLMNVSSAVIGAHMGVEYSLEPEDFWIYILAWVVFLSTISWYAHQVFRLEKLRRLHMAMIWADAEPPKTVKDVDDPLFMLMMKVGLKPRMRVKGEFGPPDEDKAEPARTERALEHAFFWPTRIMYLCGYGTGDKEHVTDAKYAKKKLSCLTRTCCETKERPGDALERGPMWLDEAKGGRGVHYLSVQLGLQLVAGTLSGFLEAHPWKLSSIGSLLLMSGLLCTQFLSLLWCAANTASDYLKATQALLVYGCEFFASLLVFVSGFVAQADLEASLVLAVRAADIMLYCAFVPMLLMGWDNLVGPPFKMFIKSEGGTFETLYLMGIALVLLPISFASAAFGFEAGGGDHLMDVVGAMDMVAGDVAATADENGEAESAPADEGGEA